MTSRSGWPWLAGVFWVTLAFAACRPGGPPATRAPPTATSTPFVPSPTTPAAETAVPGPHLSAPTATAVPSPASASTPIPALAPGAAPSAAPAGAPERSIVASPTSAPPPPTATSLARASIPSPPPRDLVDLQRRLKPSTLPVGTPTPRPHPDYPIGIEQTFWIANQQSKTYYQSTARLVHKTEHTYWYVEKGVNLPLADVQAAAAYFEAQTYPTEHRYFGSEPNPGADNDPRLTILIGHIVDVGGYYSTADEYPRTVNPYSNEREMIYINVDSVRPGSAGFNGTVAHEFMHMIQFNVHRDQESWINEGSAELAAQAVTGAASAAIPAFERHPDTQLNEWASEPATQVPHYGAAYLFMRYVAEQFGGFGTIGKLVAEPGRGTDAFAQLFANLRPSRSFDDVFAAWVAANAVNDLTLDDRRYGYKGLTLHLQMQPGPSLGQTTKGQATQFGATYYQIAPASAALLRFQGAPTVRLLGGDPHGARFEWWSNRGDSIDSRLTRTVDLGAVRAATLSFWAWYDIEDGFDYAYVEVSVDGGKTWTTLATRDTTTANPNGQNYGNGLTGTSGGKTPTWVAESADLTPYAGRRIQLRFEYVTDDSYNADGLAIDGIQIPEVGWRDDVADDGGWVAEGFVRTDNRVPQRYLVEALGSGSTPVRQAPVDASGRAALPLAGGETVTVAIAGLTPLTRHQSEYELSLSPR